MTATSTLAHELSDDLMRLLARRCPQQFVAAAMTEDITTICRRLGLSRPTALALTCGEDGLRAGGLRDVRLGDRAVYSRYTTRVGHRFSSAAIDDCAGAVIALAAAARLQQAGIPVAVVLSDG